jgi:hypothetical protein
MTWNEWKTAQASSLRARFYLYLVGNLRSDLPAAGSIQRSWLSPCGVWISVKLAGIGSPARHHHDEQRDPAAQWSSDRHPKGGRLQIGMAEIKSESVADFIPQSVADLLRNQHATTR